MVATRSRTDVAALKVTCSANTEPTMSSAAVDRLLLALSDVVAAGWAVSSLVIAPRKGHVAKWEDPRWHINVPGYVHRDAGTRLGERRMLTQTTAPFPFLRRSVISTIGISYSNPLEGQFLVPDVGGTASSLVNVIKTLATVAAERKKAGAEASVKQLEAILAEALADESVDEAFYRMQRAEQEYRLRESEIALAELRLEQARLENESLRLDVAQKAHQLSVEVASSEGKLEDAVGEEALLALFDNLRVLRSLRIAGSVGLHVDVERVPDEI